MTLFSPDLPYELNLEIWLYLDYATTRYLSLLTRNQKTPQSEIYLLIDRDPSAWVTRAHRELNIDSTAFWTRSPVESALPLPTTPSEAKYARYRYVELVSRTGVTYGSEFFLDRHEVCYRAAQAGLIGVVRKLVPSLIAHQETYLGIDYRLNSTLKRCVIALRDQDPVFLQELKNHLEEHERNDLDSVIQGIKGQDVEDDRPAEERGDYFYQLIIKGHLDKVRTLLRANPDYLRPNNFALRASLINGALRYGDQDFLQELRPADVELNDPEEMGEILGQTKNPDLLRYVLNHIHDQDFPRFLESLFGHCLTSGSLELIERFRAILKQEDAVCYGFEMDDPRFLLKVIVRRTYLLDGLIGPDGLKLAEYVLGLGLTKEQIQGLDRTQQYKKHPCCFKAIRQWLYGV